MCTQLLMPFVRCTEKQLLLNSRKRRAVMHFCRLSAVKSHRALQTQCVVCLPNLLRSEMSKSSDTLQKVSFSHF